MASNKDEEADEELLPQLKSLKLRSALGHAGLMISLSIYCVVGGVVSMSKVCVCVALMQTAQGKNWMDFLAGVTISTMSIVSNSSNRLLLYDAFFHLFCFALLRFVSFRFIPYGIGKVS